MLDECFLVDDDYYMDDDYQGEEDYDDDYDDGRIKGKQEMHVYGDNSATRKKIHFFSDSDDTLGFF